MDIRVYFPYNETEIKQLYASVGWTAYTERLSLLIEGFARSLLVLAAYENDELLGIVRAVGDGSTILYIQDLLVFPAHQRKGVGSALLQAALRQYPHIRQTVLITDDTEKTAAFYSANGFSALSAFGCFGFMKIQTHGGTNGTAIDTDRT